MTIASVTSPRANPSTRLAIRQLTVAGAATAAVLFLLCWVGTVFAFVSAPHAYIGLFTDAPANSVQALWQGLVWSALFGGLAAAVFAIAFNLAAGLRR